MNWHQPIATLTTSSVWSIIWILFWLMKRIVATLSNRKLRYTGCRKVLNHVLILKYCFIHWKDNRWSTVTLSLEIVGEGLVLLTGLDWCLLLLGHSLVELCTWVTSGWWNTCVCFHGLIIKKKKNCLSVANNHCWRWQSLATGTWYNIFCPFQGIIENNFCLSAAFIFCSEISRGVVILLCLFVQVYETCTSTLVLTRVVWLYHVPVQGIVSNSVLKLVAS